MPEQKLSAQLLQLERTRFFPSAVAATFLLWLLWWWHGHWAAPLPPAEELSGFFNIPALRFKLFESGPIPYAISWALLFGLIYLFQIWRKKVAPLSLSSISDREALQAAHSGNYSALVQALNKQAKEGLFGYYGRRLHHLTERFSRDQDLSAVTALKNEILEIDEEDFTLAFVAITWCELALPLLGFLGTVVGIGGAIDGIQKGVQVLFQGGKMTADVLQQFNQGFQSMAVAFDTTFLGLAGLVILGILHTSFKKLLAAQLAQARSLFSDIVSGWISPGTDLIVISLRELEARVQATEEAVRSGEEAVRSGDMRATLFRETMRTMAERVIIEDPAFQSVRNVLFKPVVEFQEVGKELIKKTKEHVTGKLGTDNWKLVSLGLPSFASHGGVTVVQAEDLPDQLLFFEIDGKREGELFSTEFRFTRLLPSSDSHRLIALTDSGDLMSTTDQSSYKRLVTGIGADEPVLQVTVDKRELALIIRRQAQSFDVNWMDINLRDKPVNLCRLPEDFTWSVWSVHAPSATLLAAGKSLLGTRWRLLIVLIRRQATRDKKEQGQDLVVEFQSLDLPSNLVPQQIVGITNDEILILDDTGNLHYWDRTRPSPLALSHRAWVANPNSTIRAGVRGWIAVAVNNRLTMWRVRRGGFLHPYETQADGFDISAVNIDTLSATSDGRYLLAIAGQNIITWEFPRYVVDEL